MTVDPTEGGTTAPELRRALALSEQRYRTLVDRAGYGTFRFSPAGRFLEVNSSLVAMLGYDAPESVYRLDLATEVYLNPAEEGGLRQRANGPAFVDWVETRWKRRDGTAVVVRLSTRQSSDDAGGEPEAYEGIVEDVTERQRREEMLRRSERMASLGSTLAGVAHELNNPLAAITGFAQLLLKKWWPEDDRTALETIDYEARRSATIVRDLLTLVRERDGERRVRTNLNDVAERAAHTRRYAIWTAGIMCELQVDRTIPDVLGDRTQLEQVVLNLLINAEQAAASTAGPGRIIVRTRREGDYAVLEVEDNGPGISAEERSQIWDPFWTTKQEGEGTGLGLSIVRGIVSDHGGTVVLSGGDETNDDGLGGARFVIRLPVASAGVDADARARPGPQPLDVLVVDPGSSDLGFVERFLSSRGHAVLDATTAEQALRLAAQSDFDAVLCDADLLSCDGRPLAEVLRASAGCARARFVLATDGALDARSGSTDMRFVHRPYDVEELRRLIEGD
jgi:PAS domain S-box-containing protein